MTTKHTPGPWHLSAAKDCIWHQDHGRICTPPNHAQVWNWEPNARLIAAAPELLEALEDLEQQGWFKHIVSLCKKETSDSSLFDSVTKARAAIAKARGAQ